MKSDEIKKVISHLQADLVWSDDFDQIRDSLAGLFDAIDDLPAEVQEQLQPSLGWLIEDIIGD